MFLAHIMLINEPLHAKTFDVTVCQSFIFDMFIIYNVVKYKLLKDDQLIGFVCISVSTTVKRATE